MPHNVTVRPDVVEALQRIDTDGHVVPHRLSGFDYVAVFMIGGMRRRAVPIEHLVIGETEEGYTAAIVSCACGKGATVEVARYPQKCENCHRWFFFDGTVVWSLVADETTRRKPPLA